MRPAERWPDQLVARSRAGRTVARARGQPRRQRLHLGRPDRGTSCRPSPDLRPRLRDRPDRRQRCRRGVAAGALRGQHRDDPRHAHRRACRPIGSWPSRPPTTRSPRPAPTTATRAASTTGSSPSTRPWRGSRPSAGSRSSTSSTCRCGAATDRSLVANDGLHPSGAQYARWVERILPVVAGAHRALTRPAATVRARPA